jgi:Dyp-type peroxidase family
MFYAEPAEFDSFYHEAKTEKWDDAFEEITTLDSSAMDGAEPFGFADGISQPTIDWEQSRRTTWPQYDYSNVVALGEFLLGYPNEYGKITDRPLLDAKAATANLLPALDAPDKKDLGKNGTYLVMRQLDQDVRKFWQFVYSQSDNHATAAEQLAACMVGRQRSGEPLVPIQTNPIPGIRPDPEELQKNQFTFEQDATGSRCPLGAHVRRTNPRNSDFPNRPGFFGKILTMIGFGPKGFRDDLTSSVRYHRILRRGRKYGPQLDPAEALEPPSPQEPERGLHFVCLNANISRQFEFIQNAWIANTKFSGLIGESDPLLGNRLPIPGCLETDGFTIQADDDLRKRTSGIPQFVTVRGGAFFFLPSIRALRYFAGS